MSLKITVEVDGQSEQQLVPVMGQWVARHSEWLKAQNTVSAPTDASDFYRENAALLQQQIQQLMAQNKLLQQQVSQSQRLLGGAPQPYALPLAEDAQRAIAASAVAPSYDESEAPPLPMQYQLTQGEVLRERFQRLAKQLPARLWQTLIWLAFGKKWLLLLLLFCSGMSSAFILASRLWPPPEFIDSAGGSPGTVVTPEPMPASPEPEAIEPAQPTSPTSKAGSHPPPPPAFQQP